LASQEGVGIKDEIHLFMCPCISLLNKKN